MIKVKKILFIGKFNEIFQDKSFLDGLYSVQICVDNAQMVKGMLKIKHPELVVVSLIGISADAEKIFEELKSNYSNLEVQFNETGNKIYMMDNITLEREFVNAQVELVRVKNDISDVESALSMGKQASEVDKRLQLAKDDLKIAQEAYNSLSVK